MTSTYFLYLIEDMIRHKSYLYDFYGKRVCKEMVGKCINEIENCCFGIKVLKLNDS